MVGAQARLGATGMAMQKTGRLLTRALTLPILATAAAGTKFAIDFEQQLTMIHTQAGASAAEVVKMHDAILSLAPATRYGPVELSKAMYHIESVGARGTNALNILKVASQGAATGNADLEATASALAGTMRVYHVPFKDAIKVMGDLNAVVGAGNMRMQDLNNAIGTALLPTAQGMGLSIREVGAALAVMTDESTPAQVAATRLRTLLLLMSGETKKSADTLKTLGITSKQLGESMQKPGGMINALKILRDHMRGLDDVSKTQVLAKAFGGARSSGTIIQLLNNLGMVQTKLHQINETAGNFPAAVIATTKTEIYKLHQAWAAIQTVLIRIGEIIAPVLSQFAAWIARLTQEFSSLSPHLQHMIVWGAMIAAAIGPAVFIFGMLASAIAAATGPVGLVVIGLGALAAVAAKLGILKPVAGFVAGAAIALGAMAVALNAVGFAETVALKGMYALDAVMALNPWLVAAAAIGGLVGMLIGLTWGVNNDSAAFRAGSAAIKGWTQAANDAHDSGLALKDAHLGVQVAQDQLARSRQNLTRLEKSGHASALDLREAHHQVSGALLTLAHAQDTNSKALEKSLHDHAALRHAHDAAVASLSKLKLSYQGLQTNLDKSTTAMKGSANSTIAATVNHQMAADNAKKYAGELHKLAGEVQKVVEQNKKSNPEIATAAAKIRDQASATEALTKKLNRIPKAIDDTAQGAKREANALAAGIKSGILTGVDGLGSSLGGKLSAQVNAAIAQAKASIGAKSPSTVTRDQLGKPLGEGVILGFLLGVSDLPTKMKQKLQDALQAAQRVVQESQSKFQTAFTRLADYAMRAFDARTQSHLDKMKTNFDAKIKKMITVPLASAQDAASGKHDTLTAGIDAARGALTPAEKELAGLQKAHDEFYRQEAITNARGALSTAQSGTDPQAVIDAQRTLNAALYDERVSNLQDQAGVERTAADAAAKLLQGVEDDRYKAEGIALQTRFDTLQASMQKTFDRNVLNYQSLRDLQKQHLGDMLTALQIRLSQHPEEWRKIHAKIMKIFTLEFGPDYSTAGKNLGVGFARGIRESFGSVQSALIELATLIAKYVKLKSPAQLGPLSTLDTWWKPFAPTLLRGLDQAAIAGALSGTLTPRGGGPGIGTSGGGSLTQTGAHASNAPLVHIQEQHIHNEVDPLAAAVTLGRKLAFR